MLSPSQTMPVEFNCAFQYPPKLPNMWPRFSPITKHNPAYLSSVSSLTTPSLRTLWYRMVRKPSLPRVHGLGFMASPPRSPQSNGRAESTVGYCKSKARTFRQASGASTNLHSLALAWAAITSNFLPSNADPLGQNRSPADIFPDYPYRHHNL